MKKLILAVILITIVISTSIYAQSFGQTSGCATYNPGECPLFTFHGWVPLPLIKTFVSFPNGVPPMSGMDEIYVEGEVFVTSGFDCDQFTLIGYHDIIVDYYSACDACPKDNVGDVNVDGVINVDDLLFLQNYFSGIGPVPSNLGYADVNGDCVLDFNDITVLDEFVNNLGPALAECVCPNVEIDTCANQLPGDLNNDGEITIDDVIFFYEFLGDNLANSDPNGDCIIDDNDYQYLLDFFFSGGPPPVDCTCISPRTSCPDQKPGDFNSDGLFDITDITFFTSYIHSGGPAPNPIANADANGDCNINVGDSKHLLDYLFNGGIHPVYCTCEFPEYMTPCCWERRGNVDYDPADQVDISDLVAMVDFIFLISPSFLCWEEVNVDGSSDEKVDISDLVALVDFIFLEGPPPALCP